MLCSATAHGVVAWGLATWVIAAVLGTGAASLIGKGASGLFQGAAQGASSNPSTDYFVDMLLRPGPVTAVVTTPPTDSAATRREVGLIFARDFGSGADFPDADRAYLAQIVASRSGLNQEEADKRVSNVIAQTKAYLDS